jgi:hypothetical protein
MRFSTPRQSVKSKGKKHKHSDRLCLSDLWSNKRGPAGGRGNGKTRAKAKAPAEQRPVAGAVERHRRDGGRPLKGAGAVNQKIAPPACPLRRSGSRWGLAYREGRAIQPRASARASSKACSTSPAEEASGNTPPPTSSPSSINRRRNPPPSSGGRGVIS